MLTRARSASLFEILGALPDSPTLVYPRADKRFKILNRQFNVIQMAYAALSRRAGKSLQF